MSDIVLGYDGEDPSKAALREAVDLAKALGDRIVVVFGYAPHGYGGGEVPTHREAVKEIGEKLAAEAADSAAASGAQAEVELRNAKAAHALIEVAEERDARMIVIGSHGEGPLKGAVLGSTAHSLVQIATKPVLVVHP